jgi:hypothetical protein
MKRIHRTLMAAGFFLMVIAPAKLIAKRLPVIIPDTPVAVMEQVIPDEAMPGEVVTVKGYGLEATSVRQVYLMWGMSEFKVQILKQTSTTIRFKVPVDMPPGPMRLAVMLAGRPELVEQPVMLVVLEGAMTARRHTPAR